MVWALALTRGRKTPKASILVALGGCGCLVPRQGNAKLGLAVKSRKKAYKIAFDLFVREGRAHLLLSPFYEHTFFQITDY